MKILKLFILVLALPFLGCEKDIMDYEGGEGVYFSVQHPINYGGVSSWPYQPYTNVEFVKLAKNEYDLKVNVMITGSSKDYDRVFKVEINPDSTTAELNVHYNALPAQLIVPAHAVSTSVPITIKRTEDLRKTMKTIGLRLVANENFKLSFPNWNALPSYTAGTVVKKFDASLHTIRINDFMVQPAIWIGSIQPGNREAGRWGAFTQKKLELMMKLMDLTYNDFMSVETMPSILNGLVASTCARYLIARFNAGDPVLEDDGRLMFIGDVPWTSYIGVPYLPKP